MTRSKLPVLAAVLVVLACSTAVPPDMPAPPAEPIDACDAGNPVGTVTIQYLRAGGFAIAYRDEALLTAPFYSNPSFLRVGLHLPISPDPERIPERPALIASSRVAGVLVGHAHYDHLMDLPAVLTKWNLADTPVYGDETARQQLANVEWPGPAFAINEYGGSWRTPGTWLGLPAGPSPLEGRPRFRVMPLLSEHAPHLPFGIKLYQGHVGPADGKPRTASGWKEGQTWAYLIDVLADDGKTVLLRIHYQDSASNPELGWPPQSVTDERHVDLVIFCAASFSLVREHPQAVLRALTPRYALAAHWEDFASDPHPPARVVPLTDMPELLARLRGSLPAGHFSVPLPGQQIRFSVCTPP